MKHVYKLFFTILIVTAVSMLTAPASSAQCSGGYTPGATAYDTTISFASGVVSTQVKFPQFDPQNGTVNCVRVCMTITGVIDTFAVENLSGAVNNVTYDYNRTDQMTGPGLSSPISNSVSQHYGTYALAPWDGTFGSGPDLVTFAHDTVLNKQLCRVLTDSATIAQFYGTDSMTYNYDINVSTSFMAGGSQSNFILTSASVRVHFEYCYCPPVILPNSIFPIKSTKLNANTGDISWKQPNLLEKGYVYEVEVSPDGNHFYPAATVKPEDMENDGFYHYRYTPSSDQQTNYYFRVRVKYPSGAYRLSQTASLLLGSRKSSFTIFPNPSNGIVGIKFDGNNAANLIIQIVNINGQTIYNGKMEVNGPAYKQVTTLSTGMYWLRLTDVTGQLSNVNQLLIIK